eukprot:scaffold1920_cov97-Skeletonema_dohrnii-CCMP3373.AAC.3
MRRSRRAGGWSQRRGRKHLRPLEASDDLTADLHIHCRRAYDGKSLTLNNPRQKSFASAADAWFQTLVL